MPQALLASESTSPPSYEVEDQNNHCDDEQDVDQAAGDMEAETQEPQNQKNDHHCPEHNFSFVPRAHGIDVWIPCAREVSQAMTSWMQSPGPLHP